MKKRIEVPEQRIVLKERLSSSLGWKLKEVFRVRTRGRRESDEVVVVPERWELKHDVVVVVGCRCKCKGIGLTQQLKDMFVQFWSSNFPPTIFSPPNIIMGKIPF